MCEYFGYRVEKLVRVRIMNIELGSLKSGTYRNVTEEEYHELLRLTADSSSDPVMPAKDGEKRDDTGRTDQNLQEQIAYHSDRYYNPG